MADLTILLSSGGRRAALVAALREGATAAGLSARIVVSDLSPLSSAGHLADSFHLVPPVTAPEYVAATEDLIEREQVDVVVPTIDPELPILAEHRDRLESTGARVLVSDPETIRICSNKARSSAWLSGAGFPVPAQYDAEKLDDVPASAWPLFFKPLRGSSSIGAGAVGSVAEVRHAEAAHGPGVVEELVVGAEHTMDCWVDAGGTCVAVVPRHRLATRAGEIAKGVTVRHLALQAEVKRLVEALPGARGAITVQAMLTEAGPRYIEVNPRFGGGYPLSHAAGAWYTAALAAETVGKPTDASWFEWQDDLVMLRYDDAVFVPKSAVDAIGP